MALIDDLFLKAQKQTCMGVSVSRFRNAEIRYAAPVHQSMFHRNSVLNYYNLGSESIRVSGIRVGDVALVDLSGGDLPIDEILDEMEGRDARSRNHHRSWF